MAACGRCAHLVKLTMQVDMRALIWRVSRVKLNLPNAQQGRDGEALDGTD